MVGGTKKQNVQNMGGVTRERSESSRVGQCEIRRKGEREGELMVNTVGCGRSSRARSAVVGAAVAAGVVGAATAVVGVAPKTVAEEVAAGGGAEGAVGGRQEKRGEGGAVRTAVEAVKG